MMSPWFVDQIKAADGRTYTYNSSTDEWVCTKSSGIGLGDIFSFIGVISTLGTVVYSGIKYVANKNEFWLVSTRRKLLERGFTKEDLELFLPADSAVFGVSKMDIIEEIVSERIKIENKNNLHKPINPEWFFTYCRNLKINHINKEKEFFGKDRKVETEKFDKLIDIEKQLIANRLKNQQEEGKQDDTDHL